MCSVNHPYAGVGEDFYDTRIENRSVKKLAVEMIGMALKDACQRKNIRLREDALLWIKARETSVCGYGWALANSGINPNVVRRTLEDAERMYRDKIVMQQREETVLAVVEV